MGLVPSANDFKAGKGVEKDAPRKTGIGRFFELVGRDMNGMFLANLLTCIGFAPVICLVYIGFLQNSLPVMPASRPPTIRLLAILLPSPTKQSFCPASGPRLSRMVMRSAST